MSAMAPAFVAWLQTAADSAGTRLVVERSWLETIVNIGQSFVSLLVLIMLVLGVFVLYALKKSIEEVTRLIKTVYEPVAAAAMETRDAARDILSLTKTARAQMDVISGTITEANERAHDVMHNAERRLRRFDALVEVVQDEAEELVVGAAATLRGVRTSGALLGRSVGITAGDGRRRRPRRTGPMEEEDAGGESTNGGRAEHRKEDDLDAAYDGPRIRSRRRTT